MPATPNYHKIQSVFQRDPDDHYKTFLMGEWSQPEFRYLADLKWVATEKIDGTNARIHIDGHSTVGGRTDNSQLHVQLLVELQRIGRVGVEAKLDGLTLYGEGYGAGIQKGGGYRATKGFILFDVMVTNTGTFLERENVNDIARQLGIDAVSEVWRGNLNEAVEWFGTDMPVYSVIRDTPAEGWVLRPETELRTRLGERVITKIKTADFPHRRN